MWCSRREPLICGSVCWLERRPCPVKPSQQLLGMWARVEQVVVQLLPALFTVYATSHQSQTRGVGGEFEL